MILYNTILDNCRVHIFSSKYGMCTEVDYMLYHLTIVNNFWRVESIQNMFSEHIIELEINNNVASRKIPNIIANPSNFFNKEIGKRN